MCNVKQLQKYLQWLEERTKEKSLEDAGMIQMGYDLDTNEEYVKGSTWKIARTLYFYI